MANKGRLQMVEQRRPMIAQGLRFLLSGGLVALIYLLTTTVLAEVVGVTFQLALAIGFGLALGCHFALQRLFVWQHLQGFALSLRHQVARYLALAAAQYGITAGVTATLPRILGAPTEIVYLCCAAVLTVANFAVFRLRVFHGTHAPIA